MKNTSKKSTSLSGFCLIVLTVLIGVGAAHAQTITYKRAIKLPPHFSNHLSLNDSGLGATDLDTQVDSSGEIYPSPKSRYVISSKQLWTMYERGDGTAYFGIARATTAVLIPSSVAERHVNTSGTYPQHEVLFGVIGQSMRFNLITYNGQALPDSGWLTGLPSARAISFGGNNTVIVTGRPISFSNTRMFSINLITRETTPFYTDALVDTGKSIGNNFAQAYGADNNLYLWDLDNRRILTFDTGVNGGTRGTLLRAFDLDPTKTANNSMTVDLVGNFYIGDGEGGFNMYDKYGQWKQGFQATYQHDPDAPSFFPYMNYYASGLNDGKGTLDIRDGTGYRQYTISLSPTAANVSVSGRVTARGRGISNVVVRLTSQNGEIQTVRTNRLGYYTFKELAAGETYIFNVFSKRYQFDPKVINLTEDLSEIDFAAQ